MSSKRSKNYFRNANSLKLDAEKKGKLQQRLEEFCEDIPTEDLAYVLLSLHVDKTISSLIQKSLKKELGSISFYWVEPEKEIFENLKVFPRKVKEFIKDLTLEQVASLMKKSPEPLFKNWENLLQRRFESMKDQLLQNPEELKEFISSAMEYLPEEYKKEIEKIAEDITEKEISKTEMVGYTDKR